MKNANQGSLNPGGFAWASRCVANSPLSKQFRPGLLILVASLCLSAAAQTNEWTWIGGSNLAGQSSATTPISSGTSWKDSNGNVWLFGGSVNQGSTNVSFNYLWELSPSTQAWTLLSGTASVPESCAGAERCSYPGVYGTLGVPAPTNHPGGRDGAVGWSDRDGNEWIFGGLGLDASENSVELNDLWKFNPSTKEWTWMAGSGVFSPSAVYGTLGTPAPENIPGARAYAASVTDSKGNVWMFGGDGFDSIGAWSYLNDLWEFNPSTIAWTWMGGSNTVGPSGQQGVYGTRGVAAAGNVPGSRELLAIVVDSNDHLWIFGGAGYDSSFQSEFYDDLWEFDPSSMEWTWEGGSGAEGPCVTSSTVYCGWPGVYGAQGIPASGSNPGSRDDMNAWIDSQGNLWIFGGWGWASSSTMNLMNDLWEYDFSTKEWAWVRGNDSFPTVCVHILNCSWAGIYGVEGMPSASNNPGARVHANSWTDKSGDLWLFGGIGYDSLDDFGGLNDLWEYQLTASSVFLFGASPSSLAVKSGGQGLVTLTVTPQNGFNSAVSFACSGLPSGVTCSFSPPTVTPSGGAATTQLTISASALAMSQRRSSQPFGPTAALTMAVCLIGWKKRGRGLQLLLLAGAFSALGFVSACGGGGGTGGGGGGGSGGGGTPVTSTVTVVAVSGAIQQTTTISLTVN